VPLSVLGNMNSEADGGGLQAPASNLANVAEVGWRQGADELCVTIERSADGGEEFFGRFVATTFGVQRGELFGAELAAFEIGAKAFGASSEMFGMEAGGGHAVWRGPELADSKRREGALDVFADVFAGAEQVSDDGVNAGVDSPYPWFREEFSKGLRQENIILRRSA